MTTKVRLIKILHDQQEVAQPPLKRSPLRPAMLYLMELRSHLTDAQLAKKKRVIPIEILNEVELPQEIKITHLPVNGHTVLDGTLTPLG